MSAEVIPLYSDRQRLEAEMAAKYRQGNELIKQARGLNERANVCFDDAYRIEKQLEALK